MLKLRELKCASFLLTKREPEALLRRMLLNCTCASFLLTKRERPLLTNCLGAVLAACCACSYSCLQIKIAILVRTWEEICKITDKSLLPFSPALSYILRTSFWPCLRHGSLASSLPSPSALAISLLGALPPNPLFPRV